VKLSDIMSHADLSGYAQVALLLFLGVFVAITIRTFAPSRSRELDQVAQLPFDDDGVRVPRLQEPRS
jgi:cbb3-type cytochrome oxidase subunit 3